MQSAPDRTARWDSLIRFLPSVSVQYRAEGGMRIHGTVTAVWPDAFSCTTVEEWFSMHFVSLGHGVLSLTRAIDIQYI